MNKKEISTLLLAAITIIATCEAAPTWHCSKIKNLADQDKSASISKESQFSIASLGGDADVIGISVRDLIDIYSGTTVSLGGVALSACLWRGEEPLTMSALQSLGLQPSVAQSLTRRSAIIQSNIHLVNDANQMLQCIADRYPAVGYLPNSVETEKVSPCF